MHELCLVPDGEVQRCSLCGFPFHRDVKPSVSLAFAWHLRKVHWLAQTGEGKGEAATKEGVAESDA